MTDGTRVLEDALRENLHENLGVMVAGEAARGGALAQFYKDVGDELGCAVIEALGDYRYQRATHPNQTLQKSWKEAWGTMRTGLMLSRLGRAAGLARRSRSDDYIFGLDI